MARRISPQVSCTVRSSYQAAQVYATLSVEEALQDLADRDLCRPETNPLAAVQMVADIDSVSAYAD